MGVTLSPSRMVTCRTRLGGMLEKWLSSPEAFSASMLIRILFTNSFQKMNTLGIMGLLDVPVTFMYADDRSPILPGVCALLQAGGLQVGSKILSFCR